MRLSNYACATLLGMFFSNSNCSVQSNILEVTISFCLWPNIRLFQEVSSPIYFSIHLILSAKVKKIYSNNISSVYRVYWTPKENFIFSDLELLNMNLWPPCTTNGFLIQWVSKVLLQFWCWQMSLYSVNVLVSFIVIVSYLSNMILQEFQVNLN